jgi:hypothetical protein
VGYVDPIAIADAGSEKAVVVTPSLSVAALQHGYPVEVHPSAVLEERTSQTDRIDFGASTVQPSKDSAGLTNSPRSTTNIAEVPR